ncbi:hypothetical protein KCU88_g11, partial [Aureobasidium melanogenum]
LIAAVASCLADDRGLNWPRVIAPFEAVILAAKPDSKRIQAAEQLYDQLSAPGPAAVAADVLLDDRHDQGLGWKLKDADMIGYPVIVVLGKGFDRGMVEVQCRRLNIKQEVELERVVEYLCLLSWIDSVQINIRILSILFRLPFISITYKACI